MGIVAGVCLSLILILATFVSADTATVPDGVESTQPAIQPWYQAPESPQPEVLPPSIMPVVVVSGSSYEMGYQYGQQAAPYVAAQKVEEWGRVAELGLTYDQIIMNLKKAQWHIRQHSPEAIDEIKGIADGTKDAGYDVSYVDVLLMNNHWQMYVWISYGGNTPDSTNGEWEKEHLPPGGPKWPAPPSGLSQTAGGKGEVDEAGQTCSGFAAWGNTTKDGQLICGDSADSYYSYLITKVAFPDEGWPYVTTAIPGKLASHSSMNYRGVFVSLGGIFPPFRSGGDGCPTATNTAHVARYSDNAEEGAEYLVEAGAADANFYILADPQDSGHGYAVERIWGAGAYREAGDHGEGDWIHTANTTWISDEGGLPDWHAEYGAEYVDGGGWYFSPGDAGKMSRNWEIHNFFTQYEGDIDIEFAKMMYRFPGDSMSWPPAKHMYEDITGIGGESDWLICNTSNRRTHVALPVDSVEEDGYGELYVCTGSPGKVVWPPTAPTGSPAWPIEPTHSFYKITLRGNPDGVVYSAYRDAIRCIGEAYLEIMGLDITDDGYAAANELFSEANAELYKGVDARYEALDTTGNEQLYYFGLAMTAFTRAQALANQLHNELVPSPNDPTDFGLAPFSYGVYVPYP